MKFVTFPGVMGNPDAVEVNAMLSVPKEKGKGKYNELIKNETYRTR
ncbi:MAG: hypothetical protein LLG37_09145 [Spirochaetia bacterium]|nr:hypothetical protein [Spirochaetia bacterium]